MDENLNIDEFVEVDIEAVESEQNIEVEETIEIIEVEETEEVIIDLDEAVGWVGGNSERHYSLIGRDEPDQHTINAITGLREELDDIEKLQTVFSNEYNHANYYKWQDVPETSSGLFVTCLTADYIKVCDDTDDIFGVTVDSAAFIGGQDDVERGSEYGLVVCSGVVAVKCELDVVAGDSVVSNSFGYAKKAEGGYGYKVIGIQNINGVAYAIIPLGISVNQVNELMDEFHSFDTRLSKTETDIIAAINVATEAHNMAGKASESSSVSEEAVKNALDKILGVETDIENMYKDIESTNSIAVQAQAIAWNAVNKAETIRATAEATANQTLANVNDLIKDLEPITTWSYTDEAGEVHEGAEYFTNYVNNGVATKAEIQTVETLTEDNKSAIEKSAESFRTLVSSVDKYSVGEYSQAYGLSREQAKSILKIGMIYVPTAHKGTNSHSETFTGETIPEEFTPGGYYEWNGNDWIEYGNSVAFFSIEPNPSRVLRYWYIDSNDAPEGYEPHALYTWKDGKWTKVNILEGNVTNRIVSGIRQTANEISLEVANARGSVAALETRVDATETVVASTANWVKGTSAEGEKLYNVATIQQIADDGGSSLALVVADKDGNKVLKGASIVLGQGTEDSYIKVEADNISLDGYVTFENLKNADGKTVINGSNITTGIIQSANYVTTSGKEGVKLDLSTGAWDSPNFKVTKEGKIMATEATIFGNITATSGTIGQCKIDADGKLKVPVANIDGDITANNIEAKKGTIGSWTIREEELYSVDAGMYAGSRFTSQSLVTEYETSPIRFYAGDANRTDAPFRVLDDGSLYASAAEIEGTITATGGKIGGWNIDESMLYGRSQDQDSSYYNNIVGIYSGADKSSYDTSLVYKELSSSVKFYAGVNIKKTATLEIKDLLDAPFRVLDDGSLYASAASITGGEISIPGDDGNTTIDDFGLTIGEDSECGEIRINSTGFYCNISQWGNYNSLNESTYDRLIIGHAGIYEMGGAELGIYVTPYSSEKFVISVHDDYEGELDGTWSASSCLGTISDLTKKHTINTLTEPYSTIFDNLRPVTYKYNDGTSNRIHTGFIAQEVYDATIAAGLTTLDFAAVCYNADEGGNKTNWRIRYEEIIALNTWQIQKLKSRVSELEAKLESLIEGGATV